MNEIAAAIEAAGSVLGYDRISIWIVLTAVLVNIACALLGCLLVLRRMSLLGDAISHAILPGLALGFIFTHSRDMLPMLAGALAAGLLTAGLTQALHRLARVPEDAAMGVVFTSLFALGVLMIHQVAHDVDLDPGCVLYGVLEMIPLSSDPIPRQTVTMGIMCLAVIVFVTVLWKELKIVSFDPELAVAQGINANVIHYLLMAMVAAVTVAAFEAVGSILVVAMLIVPAATAYLLTDRLSVMMVLSASIGIATALLGRSYALHYDTSVPGMIAVAAGAFFALAVFLAPRHGVISKSVRQWRLQFRIVREDVLALLYRWQEMSPGRSLGRADAALALGGGWLPRLAIWSLERDGRVTRAAAPQSGLTLTETGTRLAQTLVKSHRLWEAYLQKVLGFPADHLHASADRTEHFINENILDEVSAAVEYPRTDPHGKPIPRREGSRTDLGKVDDHP